jgi:hypothetical protein
MASAARTEAACLVSAVAPATTANALGYSSFGVTSAIEALEQGDTDGALFWLRGVRAKLVDALAPELRPSFARQHSEEAF